MLISADQILAHLIGDYVLQSTWMAENKRKDSFACAMHVVFYALPFLWLQPSVLAMVVILGTHFLIDRYGLARYLVIAKNVAGDPDYWRAGGLTSVSLTPDGGSVAVAVGSLSRYHTATGFPAHTPPYLAVWLLIITDNIVHLLINALALRWL